MTKISPALYITAGISGLTKYHMGGVLGFLTLLLDMVFVFGDKQSDRLKGQIIRRKIRTALFCAVVFILIVFCECHFDINMLLKDIILPIGQGRFDTSVISPVDISGVILAILSVWAMKPALKKSSKFFYCLVLFCFGIIYFLTNNTLPHIYAKSNKIKVHLAKFYIKNFIIT